MIAIVDYGMGNLLSVAKAFAHLGHSVQVSGDPEVVGNADKVVLPGVGAFGACMENLRAAGLVEPLKQQVASGRPFLGICLGLQVLFDRSQERGEHAGLGILPGEVVRFAQTPGLRIPHMGWNEIVLKRPAPPLAGIPDGTRMYFVHSYFPVPENGADVAVVTRHGREFCSAVWRDNVFACQFHPEKSGQIGLRLLDNFAGL
jgi:glutamine amidotransferase